ncbi:hypothetical protein Tco_0214858 [Tanacetum coccineum]
METEDTLSSYSDSKEQHISKAKERTRTEYGFIRAFVTLFGQDVQTFTRTLFLNVDQLEKQLEKEEFQEIGSMDAFRVLKTQVNKRQMQMKEGKVDMSKALDASLVIMKSSGTEFEKHDTSSMSGNDADADDADIRPIYDEEPMATVQTTAEYNVFATVQQHAEQPKFNNEGEVNQNAEQYHKKCHLTASLTDSKRTELSNQSLESVNNRLKKTVAQFQKDFSKLEAHLAKLLKENEHLKAQIKEKVFATAALKNELRKVRGNNMDIKFVKPSILGILTFHPLRNHSVVRKPIAFKFERPKFSKLRFASQVVVKNALTKPVTPHSLPQVREFSFAKPHHMIASGSSRNISPNVSNKTSEESYGSNDLIHNHYLDDARKKAHALKDRNFIYKPSVMPSAISKRTANEPIIPPTNVNVEENNTDQAVDAQFETYEFINPFAPPRTEADESFSSNVDTLNMHTFYQRNCFDYHWTKDHPLEQVYGNPSNHVQTRRQLAIDPEMCMFMLTMSTAEPTNIKEAMADHAWIEAMQEELHQFDILKVWELVDKPFGKNMINLNWKTLYRLKQAPRAWYDKISKFLISKGFSIGLYIYQSPQGIFINQSKYALEILKKHGMNKCDTIGTPMAAKPKLDTDLSGTPVDQTRYQSMIGSLMYVTSSIPDIVQAYLKDSGFELTAFLDADHAGCLDTRKSTSEGIKFLSDKLVNWMSKEQDCIAMSTAEAEYMALSVEKGIVKLYFVRTEYQLANMFTKDLSKERFEYLVGRLGMRCLTPLELEVLANESA